MAYIWNCKDWHDFYWNQEIIEAELHKYFERKGNAENSFRSILPEARRIQYAEAIASDAVSSSDMEGVSISYDSVYSSAAQMLELNVAVTKHSDRNAQSLAQILDEASSISDSEITDSIIKDWHRRLFDGLAGVYIPKTAGEFRKGPVYVVRSSRSHESEIIYEGVPAPQIPDEIASMISFISDDSISRVVRSAVIALWMPLVHPFEDGNGRISRILADAVLFGGEGVRCVSISSAIRKRKKEYYDLFEKYDSADSMDITDWIVWYIDTVCCALDDASDVCLRKLRLSAYMATLDPSIYNSREISMLYRLASGTFFGHLTAEKWSRLTKCTSATATRDLAHLVEMKMLIRSSDGGRNTWYRLSDSITV